MHDDLRAFLQEKVDAGVKQVRVTTVLDKLEAEAKQGRAKRGRVTASDLLGAFEVAALLGVDRTRPSKWMAKGTKFGPKNEPFPAPFAKLKSGPIWLRADVERMIPFVEDRRRNGDGE